MSIHSRYRFPFAAYPAVRLVLLFAIGITVDFHLDLSSTLWIGLTTAVITLFVILSWFNRRTLKAHLYYATLACYLLAVLSFGGSWHAIFNKQDPPPTAAESNRDTREELRVSRKVSSINPRLPANT